MWSQLNGDWGLADSVFHRYLDLFGIGETLVVLVL